MQLISPDLAIEELVFTGCFRTPVRQPPAERHSGSSKKKTNPKLRSSEINSFLTFLTG
jgi:hypothetical protein